LADNVELDAGSGGATIATDDIAGAQYQRVKLIHGADGVNAGDVSAANGLPVQAATGVAFPVTDNSGSLTVDNAALAVVGGGAEATALRVTLANDSTGVVSVDDNGGSLTVDGSVSVTGSVDTELPAAASITGDNIAAPTAPSVYTFGMVYDGANWDRAPGTSADGTLVNLGANNDVTVTGSVSVTGSVAVTNAGTFATQVDGAALTALQLIDNIVQTEDAAHSSGHSGVMNLAVRRDANSTLADTDGDYAPLQVDATGSLKVAIVSGAGSGGTASTDLAAFSEGVSSGTPIMGAKFTPSALAAGDKFGIACITPYRAIHVNLRDAGGSEVSVGGGTQYTEDAVAAADPVGTVPMLVRKDTPAATVSTDGDNVAQRGSNFGASYVTLLDSSGNFVAVGGGTQYTEDDAAAANPIGTASILVRKDTPASEVGADGDNVAQRGTTYGAAYVTLLDTSGAPVSVGGGTQYDEDTVHVSGDKLTLAGAVRRDTPASGCADGDRATINVDANGRLYVACDTHAVTQSGTWNVGTVTTVTTVSTVTAVSDAQVQGKAAHDAPTSGNPVLVAGRASAAAPTDVSADGDAVSEWRLRNGAAACVITAAGALIGGDATNGLDVDVTRLPALAAGTNNIGDVDVLTVPADPFGVNADAASATGSISAKLRFIASTGIPITGTVTIAGAVTQATASSLNAQVVGAVAHDAADADNPIKVGARATTALHSATLVADADRTNLHAGVDGVVITRPHTNLEGVVTGRAAITDGSSTSVIAAQGAGVKVYITSVVIANSSATDVTVDLRDGTAGTVIATFPAPAGGGVVLPLTVPIPFSANTAVAADPSASASTVTVTLIGFKSKV
jgi:hypothetical protein